MWFDVCSNFVKGVYCDLANEYGIKLNDKCLERLEGVLSHLSPVGFSIIDHKEDFMLSIVLSQRCSKVSYLKFVVTPEDYIDIGVVYE